MDPRTAVAELECAAANAKLTREEHAYLQKLAKALCDYLDNVEPRVSASAEGSREPTMAEHGGKNGEMIRNNDHAQVVPNLEERGEL